MQHLFREVFSEAAGGENLEKEAVVGLFHD